MTVLGLALAVQIADTSGAWLEIKGKINHAGAQPTSSLADPFWSSAARHYTKVVRVPVWNEQIIWEKFATYAAQYHLGTNSVFMGRVDQQKIARANENMQTMLQQGGFDPNTLYIVEDSVVPLFAKSMNSQTDLLARFNEINIFAPGWKTCQSCLAVNNQTQIDPKISNTRLTKLGERIDLSRFGKYSKVYLGAGWSVPENWGVWSQSQKANFTLPLPAQTPKKLIIDTQAFVSGLHPTQEVDIWINGVFQKHVVLEQRFGNQIEVPLPSSIMNADKLKVDLVFPAAISPKALGIGIDERPLAIGLEAVRYD